MNDEYREEMGDRLIGKGPDHDEYCESLGYIEWHIKRGGFILSCFSPPLFDETCKVMI